jgi:hypothetical protein
MAAGTQDAAGQYVWEAAGKSLVVCVHLEVIDRMLAEVMRGFGAVPKRGAEVGGVLIGTIEQAGDQSIVRVQDFEAVDCEYKRGPSYLFLDQDYGKLEEAAQRWEPDDGRPVYAVGFFRSHTRDGMSLTEEDIALIDECFPLPEQVALLIKPSATRVSTAGFFFREDGVFQETTPLEFPFRRRELTGEEAPPRRSAEQRGMERRSRRAREDRPAQIPEPVEEYVAPERLAPRQPEPVYVARPAKSRSTIWIPLSFVFLLFGVALGFMIGLTRGPVQNEVDDFALGLVVVKADSGPADSGHAPDTSDKSGYNLSVKWDRLARAVRVAQRGVLEIEDGKYTKSVDLDTAQLSNGGIIYKNLTATVRFRLTVYPRSRVGVTETAEWKK